MWRRVVALGGDPVDGDEKSGEARILKVGRPFWVCGPDVHLLVEREGTITIVLAGDGANKGGR